jgi:hypothetical protein
MFLKARKANLMSIRMLAQELYKAKKRVEELEKEVKETAWNSPERAELESQLRKARFEAARLNAMLDGAKTP